LGFSTLKLEAGNATKSVTTHTVTNTKLFGKDLSAYDDMDIEELLTQLTPDEIEQLSKEVDPDDNLLPPNQRCKDQTSRTATGPLNRRKLLEFIERSALEQEDWPEVVPYQPGTVRGKVWTPKSVPKRGGDEEDEDIAIDLDEEYEQALSGADESDLVDLAAILGLHSMMNQDQFYESVTNKRVTQSRFESVVKSFKPKVLPFEPPNPTDVDKTIEQVRTNDANLKILNWNNIKAIGNDKFIRLFDGLKKNTQLKNLSLANTGLSDAPSRSLCEALENNSGLKVLNIESNYVSPSAIRDLIVAMNKTQVLEEFRASNQRPEVKGVKVEMEIAKAVEENKSLLRLGMHFDIPDARMRIHHHLQQNNDNIRRKRVSGDS